MFTIALVVGLGPVAAFAAGNGAGTGGGADKPLVLESVTVGDSELVSESTVEGIAIEASDQFAILKFSKNVAYSTNDTEASYIKDNCSKIHIYGADNQAVSQAVAYVNNNDSEKQYIYIKLTSPLASSTEYKIVVDEGIAAKNGTDKTTASYSYAFKTADDSNSGNVNNEDGSVNNGVEDESLDNDLQDGFVLDSSNSGDSSLAVEETSSVAGNSASSNQIAESSALAQTGDNNLALLVIFGACVFASASLFLLRKFNKYIA
jgi:LPXTG-motif cell wall-anchored protein